MGGLLYQRDDIDEDEKMILRSRVPWLTVEWDTSVPANETTHVCSKNVNMRRYRTAFRK